MAWFKDPNGNVLRSTNLLPAIFIYLNVVDGLEVRGYIPAQTMGRFRRAVYKWRADHSRVGLRLPP